ncbi:hypothetical protein [Flavobacterium sp. ov086]|uniref:hypothetical protein n=1 Tax=Flavobacterium sp. ov086 TaxID=1761785 RepID=UPI0020CDE2BC|nr:hypothetical protein [Flavobacterium sp. ov086]
MIVTFGVVISSVFSITAPLTFLAGALLVAGLGVVVAAFFIAGFTGVFDTVGFESTGFAAGVAGFAVVEAAGFAAVVLAGAGLRTGTFTGAGSTGFMLSETGWLFSEIGESIFSGVVSVGLFSIFIRF